MPHRQDAHPAHNTPEIPASLKAELLARTRHCQLFIFSHVTSAIPLRLHHQGLHEFYASLDTLDYNKLDYWDSCRTRHTAARSLQTVLYRWFRRPWSRSPGDTPKTYTLEAAMPQNGVAISLSHIFPLILYLTGYVHLEVH